MDKALVVEQAFRSFGQVEALRGVDLELNRGEWIALLGPNGAGKTTLLRAIAGYVRLDSGTVHVLGKPLEDAGSRKQARRSLGVVPQDIALYGALTPRENMLLFGKLYGVKGTELRERVEWALDWTGLTPRADHDVRGFSGGMKRRLNIACAVLHKPQVLLLDEPTVGVDPQSRQLIADMLEDQRRAGVSLLLTTHQLDDAQALCDRIVIVDHGRVIADGSLSELIEQTGGHAGRLTLHLDEPLTQDHPLARRWNVVAEDHSISCPIVNLTSDLPALLKDLEEAERKVLDMHLIRPSLHTVFLELTGRELRE